MKQTDQILNYMKQFGGITQYQALVDLGVMRLASRISDMRQCGIKINDQWVTVNNRHGEKCRVKRYSLGAEQ